MRGTVKQGGSGTAATIKEESTARSGSRRQKANNNNQSGVGGSLPGSSAPMVIKQEVKVEVKPDPDAAAAAKSPILNGEDSKTNPSSTKTSIKYETKVKVEMVNGGLHENDAKPSKTDSLTSSTPLPSAATLSNSSPPAASSPSQGDADGSKESSSQIKGCGAGVATSDAQYMQQQSQIFVFTTQLANQAGEAVLQGQFLSIIAYHCSQPATKQLLEKHPLKMNVNQSSKINNATPWLNAQTMKVNRNPPKTEINTMPPMSCMQADPSMMNPAMSGPLSCSTIGPGMNMGRSNSGLPPSMVGPRGPLMIHPSSGQMQGPGAPIMDSMSMGGAPKSYGTKIPDSELTPDQRMHRQEQMARLSQIGAVFFPDFPTDRQSEIGASVESSTSSTIVSGMNILTSKSTQCSTQTPAVMTPSCTGSVMSSCSVSMQNSCSGNLPGPCSGTIPPGPYPNQLLSSSCSGPPIHFSDPHNSCSEPPISCSRPQNHCSGPPNICSRPQNACAEPLNTCSEPQIPCSEQPNPCFGPPNPCSGPPNPCVMPMTGSTSTTTISGPSQSITSSVPSSSSSITTTTVSMSLCSNSGSSQTNTCTSSAPVTPLQPAPPCSQMTPTPNMGPSPVPCMGPSPIPVMGPSPIPGMGHSPVLGQSPNMGSSPVMGPSPGAMGMMQGQIGPGMNMPPNMMVMGGGPMGSQPNMMMGPNHAMMGNNMMMTPQNGMMGGPGMRMMGPCGSMIMGGPNSSQSMAAHMEWQRCQAEFFESKRKKGPICQDMSMMGPMGHMGNPMMGGPMGGNMMMGHMRPMGHNMGNRMQGPPPPYHGPRPMGNGPLPSPGSPSMCPITSPRPPNCTNAMRMPNSGIDSPRPLGYSNPTTPVSCGPIPSPSLSVKDQAPTSQSLPTEPMPFGRQLQSFAQQKLQQGSLPSCALATQQGITNGSNKEPSLMPVPSPQQIQYLNTFDGQELTIQKQPNTSLRDNDIQSPISSGIDSTGATLDAQTPVGNRVSGPTTPQGGPATPHTPSSDRYTGPNTPDRFPVPSPGMVPPSTPQDSKQQRFGGPSPQGPGTTTTSQTPPNPNYNSNTVGGSKTPSLDSRFPIPSPKTPGDINNGSRYPIASPIPSDSNRMPNSNGSTANNGNKIGAGFSTSPNKMDIASGEFISSAAANLPLNPNCSTPSSTQSSAPGKVFDPISSMAQMSQQLTSGQSGTSPPISSATTPTLPGPMVGPIGPGMMDSPSCMMGMPPVSTSPVMMSGPIASPSNVGGPRCSSPGSMPMMSGSAPRMVGPRLSCNNPGMVPSGFGGANIQVQPCTPNTIQYLPARAPCNSIGGPRPPPSLEFLPHFSNQGQMEKSGSTMFPNSSTPSSMCAPNVPMSSMSISGSCGPVPMNMPGGPMCTMAGPMSGPNCPVGGGNMNSPYPGPNGPMTMGPNGPMSGIPTHMGPNGPMMASPNNPMGGPMMGPNGPMSMNPSMMMGGHMGPNGQIMGPRSGGPMMRGPSPSMMNNMPSDMYSMNSPNPNMPGGPIPSGPGPNPNAMMGNSGPIYGPKGSPVNMGMSGPMGTAPDAAQPLPPSMGQSGNFKNAALMGPTTTDPTYAAQFHSFQQQLYATNTRGQMGPMVGHVMSPHGPGGPVGGVPMVPQNFSFNPK